MILIVGGGVAYEQLPNTDIVDYKLLGHTSDEIKKVNILGKSAKVENVYIHCDLNDMTFSPEVETKTIYYSTVQELVGFLTNGIDFTSTFTVPISVEINPPTSEIQGDGLPTQHTDIASNIGDTVLSRVGGMLQEESTEPLLEPQTQVDLERFQETIDMIQQEVNQTAETISTPTTIDDSGLVIIDNSQEALQARLAEREKEVNALKLQLEEGINKVVSAYKTKIKALETNHSIVLEEANKKIGGLSDKVNELVRLTARDIVALYGTTPQAKTIRRKTYTLPANVFLLVSGVGVSTASYFTEVHGLLNDSRTPVVLDLTCTQASSHYLKITTEYNAITLEKFSHYNHATKWGKGYIYPSIFANELSLLEYNFTKVLTEISAIANGMPIVILLPSFETVTTRTLLDDLMRSGAKASILCDNNPINIVSTCQMLSFLNDTSNLDLYVTKVTDAITPLLQKANTIAPVKAFRENVSWLNGGFFNR